MATSSHLGHDEKRPGPMAHKQAHERKRSEVKQRSRTNVAVGFSESARLSRTRGMSTDSEGLGISSKPRSIWTTRRRMSQQQLVSLLSQANRQAGVPWALLYSRSSHVNKLCSNRLNYLAVLAVFIGVDVIFCGLSDCLSRSCRSGDQCVWPQFATSTLNSSELGHFVVEVCTGTET